MPLSEARLDAGPDPRRVRLAGFNDTLPCEGGGVRFRDGLALDPMPARALSRLRGIGLRIEDLGPWAAVPPPAPEAPPPAAAVPSAHAEAAQTFLTVGEVAAEAADQLDQPADQSNDQPAPARRRRAPAPPPA